MTAQTENLGLPIDTAGSVGPKDCIERGFPLIDAAIKDLQDRLDALPAFPAFTTDDIGKTLKVVADGEGVALAWETDETSA